MQELEKMKNEYAQPQWLTGPDIGVQRSLSQPSGDHITQQQGLQRTFSGDPSTVGIQRTFSQPENK